MEKRYKHLTSPLVIRNKTLKSRFMYPVAQPHFLQANELYPADPVVSFYQGRAKNGAALLLMHDLTNLDQRYMGDNDVSHFSMYALDDKGAQNGFTQFAEYMHYYGSFVCPELNLDNRLPMCVNDPKVPDPNRPMMGGPMMPPPDGGSMSLDPLPGVVIEKPDRPLSGAPGRPMEGTKMMREAEMAEYIQITNNHAKKYQRLNYDGGLVDFSAGNFNLGKFISPKTNWRTDEYGGSFENRIRFPLRVLKELREAVGEEFIIIINPPAVGDGELSMQELAEFLRLASPYIDLIHLRTMTPDHEVYNHCGVAEISSELKAMGVTTPIAIRTYYKDLDSLENLIATGKADMIAQAHIFICNENMGEILQNGNGEDLNPCIECHICRGSSSTGDWMSHCTINPELGMEHRAYRMIKPALQKKKVAVIGGGPGGVKCAMWLKERGHTPVIFEKSDALGGQIKTSQYPEFKWELKRYLDFLQNQAVRKGIEVRYNTEATPEMIEKEGFDVVVAATGATPRLPAVEGAENARWNGVSVYGNEDKLGQNVVVIGGASMAAEAAIYLRQKGKNVTEISRQGRIAYDLNPIRMISYFNQKARQTGVELITNAKTTKITANSVTYLDKDGAEHTVSCDDIVATGGMQPNNNAAMAFASCAKEFYMVGDCREAGNMRLAIRDAYAVAMQI